MINEDDFTVASLAGLVGSELRTIEKFTDGKTSVNKLDPRSFLNKQQRTTDSKKNKNIAYQDGKAYYAGIDEEYVRSLHPDPQLNTIPLSPPNTTTVTSSMLPVVDQKEKLLFSKQDTLSNKAKEDILSNQIGQDQAVIKILKSIDKSLKQIATKLTSIPT